VLSFREAPAETSSAFDRVDRPDVAHFMRPGPLDFREVIHRPANSAVGGSHKLEQPRTSGFVDKLELPWPAHQSSHDHRLLSNKPVITIHYQLAPPLPERTCR
jgi:hypothetical protein